MRRCILKSKNKGQATTELAILGSVVLLLLSYLVSQAYMYNQRVGLEMYTFRKALQLSQSQQRGISLEVMRDVLAPSFFTGLNRQRLMASAVVDYNPWILYDPDCAQDIPTRQLIQINDGMIRNNYFLEVPPTQVRVITEENKDQDHDKLWRWTNSSMLGIDDVEEPGAEPNKTAARISSYTNTTTSTETAALAGGLAAKDNSRQLSNSEKISSNLQFEGEQNIKDDYARNDWEKDIIDVAINKDTIPKSIQLTIDEIIGRQKGVRTP